MAGSGLVGIMNSIQQRLRDDAEAWARESPGVQFVSGINWMGSCSPDWTDHDGSALVVRVEPEPDSPVGFLFMPERVRFTVDHLVAWLVRHAVDTGREVRRRCDDCAGSKAKPVELGIGLAGGSWGTGTIPCPTCSPKGPPISTGWCVRAAAEAQTSANTEVVRDGSHWSIVAKSKPRGYLDTPLARVVCEGAPREALRQKFGEFDHGVPSAWDPDFDEPGVNVTEQTKADGTTVWVHRGDPTARTELPVQADRLQAEPDPCGLCHGGKMYRVKAAGPGVTREQAEPQPCACMACGGSGFDEYSDAQMVLGQALALWLSGAPCEACEGEEVFPPAWNTECGRCHGHGTALAAYVAQQLDSVRTLTEDKVIDPGPSDTTHAVVGGPGRVLGSDR